jgi:hypothetical protein
MSQGNGDLVGRVRGAAQTYRRGDDRPLGGYVLVMAVFAALVAGAAGLVTARGRRLPELGPQDLLLLATGTHKLSRLLAKDPVTSPIRAPKAWSRVRPTEHRDLMTGPSQRAHREGAPHSGTAGMNNDPHAHDVLTDDRFGAQVGRLLGPPRARATRPAGTNFGRRVMRPVADGIPRHRDPDLRRWFTPDWPSTACGAASRPG